MYVVIQHTIADSKGFEAAGRKMIDQVPSNLRPLQFYPSADGSRAVCLWEGPTVDAVSAFVDKHLAKFARNEYYPVDERGSLGLPGTAGAEAHPSP